MTFETFFLALQHNFGNGIQSRQKLIRGKNGTMEGNISISLSHFSMHFITSTAHSERMARDV